MGLCEPLLLSAAHAMKTFGRSPDLEFFSCFQPPSSWFEELGVGMEWDGEIFEVEWWDRREVSLELVALSYQIQTMPLYNLSALIPPRYRSIRISPKMKLNAKTRANQRTLSSLANRGGWGMGVFVSFSEVFSSSSGLLTAAQRAYQRVALSR